MTVFVEVKVLCDTPGCNIHVMSTAVHMGPVCTPPEWTAIFMQRTEHHCPAHGAAAIDRYKQVLPVYAGSLKYEIGAP